VIGDAWRIEALLGEGAFGAVFRATHVSNGARSALKIIDPQAVDSIGGAARVRREAELASRLQHPNIVRVLGAGEDTRGWLFIALELLEGESVEAAMEKRGRMPQAAVASLMIEVLSALDEAEAHHIVHRDLKPANLFVARTSEGERVKVLDFGLAKSTRAGTAQGLTHDGATLGTPLYMAPEQIRGDPVTGRSDLFSVGLILLELASGVPLYEGQPAIRIMSDRVMGKRPPMPPDVEHSPFGPIILRATDPDPALRFANAREMLTALVEAKESLAPSPVTSWSLMEETTNAAPNHAVVAALGARLAGFSSAPTVAAFGTTPSNAPALPSSSFASGPTVAIATAPPPTLAGAAHPTVTGHAFPNPVQRTIAQAPHRGRGAAVPVAIAAGVIALGSAIAAVVMYASSGAPSARARSTTDRSHEAPAPTGSSHAVASISPPVAPPAPKAPYEFAASIPMLIHDKLGAASVATVDMTESFADVVVLSPNASGEVGLYKIEGGEISERGKATDKSAIGGSIDRFAFAKVPAMVAEARNEKHASMQQVRHVMARPGEPAGGLPAFSVYLEISGEYVHVDFDANGVRR